jgi:Kelch motif
MAAPPLELLDLPAEALSAMLSFLSPRDLAAAAQSCWALRLLLLPSEAALWRLVAWRECINSGALGFSGGSDQDPDDDLTLLVPPENDWRAFLRRRRAIAARPDVGRWLRSPWNDDFRVLSILRRSVRIRRGSPVPPFPSSSASSASSMSLGNSSAAAGAVTEPAETTAFVGVGEELTTSDVSAFVAEPDDWDDEQEEDGVCLRGLAGAAENRYPPYSYLARRKVEQTPGYATAAQLSAAGLASTTPCPARPFVPRLVREQARAVERSFGEDGLPVDMIGLIEEADGNIDTPGEDEFSSRALQRRNQFGVPSPRMSHTSEVVRLRWSEIWGDIEPCPLLKSDRPPEDDGPEKILIIGGHVTTTVRFDDLFILDPKTLFFARLTPRKGSVPKFARHASAVLAGQRKVVCFGGFNGINEMYGLALFDLDTLEWSYPQTHGDAHYNNERPRPRTNHAVARVGQYLYVFGGNVTDNDSEVETETGRITRTVDSDDDYRVLGDFWRLDLDAMTWANLGARIESQGGNMPSPRSAHRMAGTSDGRVLLFGGGRWTPIPYSNWLEKFNEVYEYDIHRECWTCIPARFAEDSAVPAQGRDILSSSSSSSSPSSNQEPFVNVSTFSMSCLVGQFWFHWGGQALNSTQCTNSLYSFDIIAREWRYHGPTPDTPIDGRAAWFDNFIRDVGSASCVNNDIFFFAGSSGEPIDELDVLRLWPELVL